MKTEKLRIAIMWTELSGYLNACLQALVDHHNVELDVTRIARKGANQHPYAESMFEWMPNLRTLLNADADQADVLFAELEFFDPDVAIISGWAMPVYRKIARTLRHRGIHVIGTADNPWHGSFRQRLGVLSAPWYVRPLFDDLWVPGERGTRFARKLGYNGQHLMQGLYSADRGHFRAIAERRKELNGTSSPRRFFFAGRFSKEKGIDELISAYVRYCAIADNPWELWMAGSGPLEDKLRNTDGVRMLGYVQPEQYDQILRQVGAFVLPSHYDPWPLVIHEMTSAGLPILCSRQCGSSVELVQDGLNGFLFDAGDVDALVGLLQHVSSEQVDLVGMGRHSEILSSRYSPEQWAAYLTDHITRNAQTK